jgi:hypothetical protein
LSSNRLCHLVDDDALAIERENLNPEITKLLGDEKYKKVKKKGWKSLPPKLKHLDVSHNPGLTSLDEIGTLRHLNTLDCSMCSLTQLGEDLSQLKKLTSINARRNRIAHLCDVTAVFPYLTCLTSIDLSGNEFIENDEKEGKGKYFMAMLESSQGRLQMLDGSKILDKDYKRYEGLKSEIHCEELVAKLNVECTDNMQKMSSILDNLASRHRLEEEVLREAIRGATMTEEKKYKEYSSFVNERLRELKLSESISPAAVLDIQKDVAAMKDSGPQYVPKPIEFPQHPQTDSTESFIGGLI